MNKLINDYIDTVVLVKFFFYYILMIPLYRQLLLLSLFHLCVSIIIIVFIPLLFHIEVSVTPRLSLKYVSLSIMKCALLAMIITFTQKVDNGIDNGGCNYISGAYIVSYYYILLLYHNISFSFIYLRFCCSFRFFRNLFTCKFHFLFCYTCIFINLSMRAC